MWLKHMVMVAERDHLVYFTSFLTLAFYGCIVAVSTINSRPLALSTLNSRHLHLKLSTSRPYTLAISTLNSRPFALSPPRPSH